MAKRKKKPLQRRKKAAIKKATTRKRMNMMKRPNKSPRRDKLGRFISSRKKNEKAKPKTKTRASTAKKSKTRRVTKKRVLRRLQKPSTRKSKPIKNLPFLDGRTVTGRDPDFQRKVTIEDKLKDIVTKAEYPLNEELGIAGRSIEIQKRTITLGAVKNFKGQGAKDWNYDPAINAKFRQLFEAEGPGLYYFKAKFFRPVGDEILPKWVSTKRRRLNTVENLEAEFFNFNTMLEISRETNVYGFQENGYGFSELELERISE